MGIIPVLLSGGSGTRLWPLSRKERPKQFLSLDQSGSFFQATVKRCSDPLFDQRPIVVAANDHRFLVAENLKELNCPADVLLEPVARNSCAAVIAGCLQALNRDPNAVVIVLAADHHVSDVAGFVETVRTAEASARAHKLVTFGIPPTFPATGYGYILRSDEAVSPNCYRVRSFVEKPDAATATNYLKEGYLWNSGNFLFEAATFLKEAKRLVPEILQAVQEAHDNRIEDLDFFRLGEEDFKSAQSISIDYAIMEKTDRATVTPATHDWSDIGTWESVWKSGQKNDEGNVLLGDVTILDGSNNLVHSKGQLTTLVGVDNMVVVTTPDAVLVCSKDNAERIKDLVAELEKSDRPEATGSRKVYRPWGNYDVIDEGHRYKVKRLEVKPGGVLSLQKHNHRSEHWVVVEGRPEVTIGEMVKTCEPNQSVYIPAKTVHRLANHGDIPAVLIEVQTGDYIGEDDIIRLEDQYNRDSR
ncbi:MAG: mannose-1-phosphate guanylyltransferase/mannose-6-phosphate isomerase [Pseudomonadota bacterium]